MPFDSNLTTERPTFVTHLECAYTGERYEADTVHNLSKAGKPLLVRYDLEGVRAALSKDALAEQSYGIPILAIRGRRGGSAMAAAAVNALASDVE